MSILDGGTIRTVDKPQRPEWADTYEASFERRSQELRRQQTADVIGTLATANAVSSQQTSAA